MAQQGLVSGVREDRMSPTEPEATAVAVEKLDGVHVWTMRLAPVNALNEQLLSALQDALDQATDEAAVVVLASELKVFSAGADASWMASTVQEIGPQGLLEQFNATMDRFRDLCVRLRAAPFLTVAAIQGHCLAGGLELAAACDLRFCADDEQLNLGVPEMDLFGCLPSGAGGAQFLTRILGTSRALEFMLHAKPVTPVQALKLGLVDRLYPKDAVRDRAVDFASQVAAKAGLFGVRSAKQAVYGGADAPFVLAMQLDRGLHWENMRRGNFLPGVDNFVKRFASKASK
jgi:enoyl-CoA hydratase